MKDAALEEPRAAATHARDAHPRDADDSGPRPLDALQAPEREAEARLERAREVGQRLLDGLRAVILGQDAALEHVVTALLAGGHVLLEGAPGLGKTQLVRTLAGLVGGEFHRIQFTPDLMPSDVLGTSLVVAVEGGGKDLAFRPGPIFAHLVLADEINRATPKTQSALLEAMAERQVTVEGRARPLPRPFFVLATENPIEMEGVYPLPEAQLDRFLVKLVLEMPDLDTLARIGARAEEPVAPGPLSSPEELAAVQATARRVPSAPHVQRYAARLVLATHGPSEVRFGAGPRAVQALMACARVRALLEGRAAVAVDDVRGVALPVLRHRLALGFEAEAKGRRAEDVVHAVLETTPVEEEA
ncbi:MAG TPA: MoxR family ATPase [Polyangiaceae bacterium LLY-WYZ-15_(1-7)]|nr:AAA family ATPase [Sandaracinus sp.]HJK90903.1 MoxR family ATPase [Polyangiaceae bacterium LLY-WYZ-15_(1-7)]MBJ73440.1 AAA family ATPase [Sandaracinus sp.]HJL00832.1 MoxR family ATPase [Polyangiaceae bacterium LLY-WYZ-15_(1-7)]HJL13520.1 MoxR family ATPase [Polyangiaceae bacterium LLY-WYZ-15_(1-7)]